MYKITIRKGASGTDSIQLRRVKDGGFEDATDQYTGSEELACAVWPGDDRAQAATLPVSWQDAPGGIVRVDFPAETTATLDVGWLSGAVWLVDGVRDLIYFSLVVESSPGSASAPPAYHTYQDLTNELPFIRELADKMQDQSGFAEASGEARRWIDAAILRAVPSQDWYQFGCGSGWGRGWGGGVAYGSTGQAEDPTIAAALNANQLMITTATGHRFVKASVYYALSRILERAVGFRTSEDLASLAARYEARAKSTLNSCTAEIDTNADGVPEYVFDLGSIQVRRA